MCRMPPPPKALNETTQRAKKPPDITNTPLQDTGDENVRKEENYEEKMKDAKKYETEKHNDNMERGTLLTK